MAAFAVDVPGPIETHPLLEVERSVPEPGPGQVRVRVLACGVCRTDLHLAEGDLQPKRPLTVPGHEVVGIVDQSGRRRRPVRGRRADRGGVARADLWGVPFLRRR